MQNQLAFSYLNAFVIWVKSTCLFDPLILEKIVRMTLWPKKIFGMVYLTILTQNFFWDGVLDHFDPKKLDVMTLNKYVTLNVNAMWNLYL